MGRELDFCELGRPIQAIDGFLSQAQTIQAADGLLPQAQTDPNPKELQ